MKRGNDGRSLVLSPSHSRLRIRAAMAKEGNLLVQLHPVDGSELDVSKAQKVVTNWETGKIPVDAADVKI
jgi:hypothetical protein